jgi:hypothetical protein
MPKKKKAEVIGTVEAPEMITSISAAPPMPPVDNNHIEEGSERFKEEFTVLNSFGSEVRTYTVDIHGENAGELAKQYASKIGGSVR